MKFSTFWVVFLTTGVQVSSAFLIQSQLSPHSIEEPREAHFGRHKGDDSITVQAARLHRQGTRITSLYSQSPNGRESSDNAATEECPTMVSDFRKRLKRIDWDKIEDEQDTYTPEEAERSASLYLNPATERISPHVKVSWEPQVADIIRRLEKVSNPNRPFMVGVVGIPGSGKSTSVDTLCAYLGDEDCVTIPMDGYHFSVEELSKFPNPADVLYRRGAPDTFNIVSLQRDLERICYGTQSEVSIPGFDHAKGDPQEDQHTFVREKHKIVICEGIYLLHDADGWDSIQKYFDWTIFIEADVDKCIARLKERNKCIPGYTAEEIETRCEVVDRSNCELSHEAAKKYACQIVSSGAS